MNGESRLIDTNVLVYAYDISEKAKRRIARGVLDEIWDHGGGVVTLQNLSEFFVVVTKKVENPIPILSARTIISDILHSRRWLAIDRQAETILKATELVEHNSAFFWVVVQFQFVGALLAAPLPGQGKPCPYTIGPRSSSGSWTIQTDPLPSFGMPSSLPACWSTEFRPLSRKTSGTLKGFQTLQSSIHSRRSAKTYGF